jgi:hypothetical protein
MNAQKVIDGIKKEEGKFIRVGEKIFVLLRGQRIEISADFNNHAYVAVQIKHCGTGTAEYSGRAICQRVAVMASEGASNIHLAKFSAVSRDKTRLYLPIAGGGLLQITPNELTAIANGENPDSFWVEHPKNDAFKFIPNSNVQGALKSFEKLCVQSQSCSESHAWFVAMHEGLFPYVRDFAKARMIVEHLGPSQQGKTSGAQRFTKLHGLGEVLGDVTAAYFRNNCDSLGLAVLDNKEHDDQLRDLIQLLLFAATGAQNGRSMQDGTAREMKDRPVVVLTSIEGVFKRELQKRVLYIPYGVRLKDEHGNRDDIEDQITLRRDELLSGLCHVLKRFIGQSTEKIRGRLAKLPPNAFGQFSGYITLLAGLLYAFETEAGHPAGWAEGIISNWFKTLGSANESEGDELETHIENLLELYEAVRVKSELMDLSPQNRAILNCFEREANYTHGGEIGVLYETAAAKLLNAMNLNRVGNNSIPKTAQAMGRRLEQAKWSTLKVLDETDDARLKRQGNKRRIGIFRPSDTAMEVRSISPLHEGVLLAKRASLDLPLR